MERSNNWELPEAHRRVIDAELDRLADQNPDAYRWFLAACASEERLVLPHAYVLPLQHARLIEYGVGDTTDYIIHWARLAAVEQHIPHAKLDFTSRGA